MKVEAWCCRDRQSIRSCQLVFPPSRHLDHLGQTQQLLKLKSDDFFVLWHSVRCVRFFIPRWQSFDYLILHCFLHYATLITNINCIDLGTFSWQNNWCSFLFCSKRGGPLPNFWSHFQEVLFWSIKESISPKMPIIWTLNCFLGCIHDLQSKYSALIQEEFWIMSHFECRLNQCFWH